MAGLVERGRYPHAGALRMLRGQSHQAIRTALALAQGTTVLLLDEPTTFLDIGRQLEILEMVQRLNRERGLTIVLVLHDLNQAARYADLDGRAPGWADRRRRR